jgi:hypothetical protein
MLFASNCSIEQIPLAMIVTDMRPLLPGAGSQPEVDSIGDASITPLQTADY